LLQGGGGGGDGGGAGDGVLPLARSRRRDWSPARGPRRRWAPSQSRSLQRAPYSAEPQLHASPLPPRPPPPRLDWAWPQSHSGLVPRQPVAPQPRPPLLQLDLVWPQPARLRLAPWRRHQSGPPGSKPEACSSKWALKGDRSFGRSPKIAADPA